MDLITVDSVADHGLQSFEYRGADRLPRPSHLRSTMFTKTIKARWKAIMPFVAYGISEALKHGFDLHTPSGWKAFVSFAFTSILVHYVPNSATASVTPLNPPAQQLPPNQGA